MKKSTAADPSRRTTLKLIGAVAASAATVGTTVVNAGTRTGNELPVINVHTRVSATTNDLEVVIANVGETDADILQLTPGETTTRRGRFDFTSVTDDNGALYLAAGDSVTVPMRRRTVVLDGSDMTTRAQSLTDTLKRGLSAQLADGQFATLSVRGLTPLV